MSPRASTCHHPSGAPASDNHSCIRLGCVLQISGYGKLFYVDGDVYEGQWKEEKMHGKGVYTYHNGDQCEFARHPPPPCALCG